MSNLKQYTKKWRMILQIVRKYKIEQQITANFECHRENIIPRNQSLMKVYLFLLYLRLRKQTQVIVKKRSKYPYNNIEAGGIKMKASENSLTESLITQERENQEATSKRDKIDSYEANLPIINGSNVLSSLFFSWLYPFISYGARKTVKVDAMPTLPQDMTSSRQFEYMKQNFENLQRGKRQGFTLIKLMMKTYFKQFLFTEIFLAIYIAIQSISPYITALIMRYISHRDDYESYYGALLFGIILVLQITRSISEAQLSYRFTKLGVNLTNSLTLLIFTKSLKYPSIAEKEFKDSEIINYSQVDAERMSSGGFELACIIIVPIQIVVGLIMMYHFIGISFLAGIGVMCVTIPCTYFTAKRSYRFNKQILTKKDQRMKVTQEMLDIIRYIKINAIQKFFYNKVNEKRTEQINFYKKKGLMDVLNIFLYWLSCPLILSATFMTYIHLGNEMNSEVAFTTIMIFTTLQYPIRLLPNSISSLIQMFTSIKRIEKFLFAKEIQTKHLNYLDDQQGEHAIKIERGNFYYSKEKQQEQSKQKEQTSSSQVRLDQKNLQEESSTSENRQSALKRNQQPLSSYENEDDYVLVLKDINTTIKKGSFTIVIGDIGSGKTSLLMAILNEMITANESTISLSGKIAYSAQKPWIMSATVKDNIVFQSLYEQQKLQDVIHYASLEQDLKILPHGIDTQIGQKGINISGGQKARISLARALYSNRDIYLLDDVLSAVDVHVGEFLMRQTLKGYLKGKTILMPTHAIKFAEVADEIIVMEKGRIVRKGHFRDIANTAQFRTIYQKEQNKSKQQKQGQEIEEEETTKIQLIKKQNTLAVQHLQPNSVADKLLRQLMLPEDQEKGQIDFQIFKEYIKFNGGYLFFAIPIAIAMTLWISFTTASAIIMEHWCEDPIGEGYDLYIYIALTVTSNLFIFFRAYKLVISGARQGQTVHKKMMKALLYASLGNFFNRVPVGRIINRLTKDLRELDEVIGIKIGNLIVDFFVTTGGLVICVYSSTPLILIPILVIAYAAFRFRNYYMKSQVEVARFQKSTNSPIVSGFISTISGLSSIRAYKMTAEFIDKQLANLDINKRVRLTKTGLQSWFSINLTYLSFFINMASIGYCILSNNPNASLAGLLMNYAINLSSSIISFTNSAAVFESKVICLQRVYSFMKIEPQPAYLQYCENWTHVEEGFQDVITSGDIQFNELRARYRQDLPDVLKGMNIKINAGEKIGIVGRTGAGKTTIINTLLRITHLSGGELLVDGKRIEDYQAKNLRYGITMIDQEPTLIKSTFKQNLDITGKYTDQQLYQILKECNLYETIMEKGGLQGAVSNDSLSAGEKQLLCICRAFLKHSKIVLVDEATANIDVKNDAIIQNVIQQKFKHCTVLTIAHRLSTLAHSDKILVMQKGEAVQFGSPAQLQRKQNGWYKQMVLKNAKQFLI